MMEEESEKKYFEPISLTNKVFMQYKSEYVEETDDNWLKMT